ncbi:MAG: hypothetical protein K0R82_1935 [Flavipsychrobacter sp.]|jgi:hypothetical protein|nr:hypothetical protein [Flavipsychrobacter sp.]
MHLRLLLCSFFSVIQVFTGLAQQAVAPAAKFSFDQGAAKNEITGAEIKAVGVTLTDDRFGNPASAYYFHGTPGSYVNLGTDSRLKPRNGTISLWFKMDNLMYAGRGYDGNPIIITKTHGGGDFHEAYSLTCDFTSRRLSTVSARVVPGDSIQAGVRTKKPIQLTRWYHAVVCYNDSIISMYLDGELQNTVSKNFRTTFLAGDSVILGHSANIKNARFFNGAIDDIEIYDRVLTQQEITALYEASDPNRSHGIIRALVAIVACAVIIVMLMLLLLKREKIKNRKQRQVYEMEMQVMKAQMNPHFIFNAMNSVQQFILANDNDNAYKYLIKFSRLLRMILESNHEEHISLEHEIEILTRYIEIEALRFDKSFSYEIVTDADLSISGIRIPQMLIQPIVENAIWHGLLPKHEDRSLSIRFERLDNKLLSCVIEDNGVGRSDRTAEQVISKRRSLAINFIHHRLELMKKEWRRNYGIEIIDKTDGRAASAGTKVVIKLPILN